MNPMLLPHSQLSISPITIEHMVGEKFGIKPSLQMQDVPGSLVDLNSRSCKAFVLEGKDKLAVTPQAMVISVSCRPVGGGGLIMRMTLANFFYGSTFCGKNSH